MHKNFYLALIGIGMGGIGFGLITPVTVMLLEQDHAPSFVTGSVTMIGYLSVVIFSSYAGRLIDKLNVKKVIIMGLFIWMVGAIGHVLWYIYPLLYPIKFIMGVGGTFVFVSTEVMINYYSNEKNRGKNIGLYVVLLSIGIAIGTLLIWTIEIGKWVPFVIGAAIMCVVLLLQMIFLEDIHLRDKNEPPPSIMPIKKMPLISLLAAIVYGLFESSVIVALPLYGLRNLFTTNEVSYFLASFVIGGVVLLYLIGLISDKINKYNLLLLISSILGVLFVFPVLFLEYWLLLIIFFFIGGIVPAFYTVGLNYTVERVEKQYMAQANGYFVMMYGAGTIVGPLLGAFLVDLNKQYGYWTMASILCAAFYILFRYNKSVRTK